MIASIFFMRWVSSCRPQPVQRECHGARATGDVQVCVLSSGALIASGHTSDPCLSDDQPAHRTGTSGDCDGGVTIELRRLTCSPTRTQRPSGPHGEIIAILPYIE